MKNPITLVVILALSLLVCSDKNYTQIVEQLRSAISDPNKDFRHSAYDRLAYISDTYGPRMWGSKVLEQVISEMLVAAHRDNFDEPRLESVGPFTKWIRGKESLILHDPRPVPTKLDVIAYGRSIPWYDWINTANSRRKQWLSETGLSWSK